MPSVCEFPIDVALVVPLSDDDRVGGVGSILGDAVERRARFEFHRRAVDRAHLRASLRLDLLLEFLFESIRVEHLDGTRGRHVTGHVIVTGTGDQAGQQEAHDHRSMHFHTMTR